MISIVPVNLFYTLIYWRLLGRRTQEYPPSTSGVERDRLRVAGLHGGLRVPGRAALRGQGIPAAQDDGAAPPQAGEQAQGRPPHVEEHLLVESELQTLSH